VSSIAEHRLSIPLSASVMHEPDSCVRDVRSGKRCSSASEGRWAPPPRRERARRYRVSVVRVSASATAVEVATVKIGTRGSPLALAQAYMTRDLLKVPCNLPNGACLGARRKTMRFRAVAWLIVDSGQANTLCEPTIAYAAPRARHSFVLLSECIAANACEPNHSVIDRMLCQRSSDGLPRGGIRP